MNTSDSPINLSPDYTRKLFSILAQNESGKNIVFSPVNIYLALGMLAEVTAGGSRAQILQLMNPDGTAGVTVAGDQMTTNPFKDLSDADTDELMEHLREQASEIYTRCYCKEKEAKLSLAASFWIRKQFSYRRNCQKQLKESYHATCHKGVMGSPELNQKLQNWLDKNTGGLLREQTSKVTLDPSTVLALATTIYFKASWNDPFSAENTAAGTFYTNDGEELTCDFMNRTSFCNYYSGKDFSAVALTMGGRYVMWFVLPGQGHASEELLADNRLTEFILSGGETLESTHKRVNITIPKFDILSDIDLSDSLQKLGITDVFQSELSDFSPLTGTDDLSLSRAQHAARLSIDEEGCEAAAYTLLAVRCTAFFPPEPPAEFKADRPFLFALTDFDGLPLFMGLVNRP